MEENAGLAGELNERFERFLARVAYKRLSIGGTEWEYMDIGNPEGEVLAFFTGGLVHPLWSFSVMDQFLGDYRILAPRYPPLPDLDCLLDGVKAILEHEGATPCRMMGSSWGGSMLQCFVYKYPEAADRIVLSNTGAVASRLMVPALKLHRAQCARKPKDKVLSEYKARIMGFWSQPSGAVKFWESLLDRYYGELFTYEDYMAMIQAQIDYLERYAFRIAKNANFNKPVLILSSSDETASTKKVRGRVRALYPDSRYIEFSSGGHAVAAANPEEFKRAVQTFFRG